jgi:hypothetical protein
MLSVAFKFIVMLNVIMLNIFMLSVVAPSDTVTKVYVHCKQNSLAQAHMSSNNIQGSLTEGEGSVRLTSLF